MKLTTEELKALLSMVRTAQSAKEIKGWGDFKIEKCEELRDKITTELAYRMGKGERLSMFNQYDNY